MTVTATSLWCHLDVVTVTCVTDKLQSYEEVTLALLGILSDMLSLVLIQWISSSCRFATDSEGSTLQWQNCGHVLNDALTVAFDVGCKSSFTSNCITPSPAQIVVSFTLLSWQYCPRVEDITISATLDTYADVSISSTSD